MISQLIKKSTAFIFFSVLAIFSIDLKATHLMGGEVTYEFVGIFGGQYRYDFQVDMYCNRLAPSNFPNGIIGGEQICVYDKQTNLPVPGIPPVQLGAGNRTLFTVFPDLPPGCNPVGLANNLSATLNRFDFTLDLPGPFSDYFVKHERCCRDGSLDNIVNPNGAGNTFYAETPPNFVENSSPQFQDIAVPFLCTGDTITFSNNAVDPDGDFLVYSFVSSYDQLNGGIAPGCGGPFDETAIPSVQFPTGFSLDQPFGPGSYAFINSTNGLTRYFAPNQGKYNVTIEISEFRDINNDGIQDLLSRTRRDLFFIVLPCATNPAPAPSPITVNGTNAPIINGTVNYDILEGESVNFNFQANDGNGDSVYISAQGSIIDGSNGYTGPLATFASTSGNGSASSNFNWNSACGFTGQYTVRFNIRDNGCPPKDEIVFFNINVRPFAAADQLQIIDPNLSPDSLCFTSDTLTYFINSNNGSNVTWQAQGGNIIGNTTSDTVQVSWNSFGLNTLDLIETSSLACTDTNTFEVFLITPDTIQATADLRICEGDSVMLNATGSSQFEWFPNVSITNNLSANPIVFPSDTITYVVRNPTPNNCSTTDSVKVDVVKDFARAGTDRFVCAGDTTPLGVVPDLGIVYSWNSASLINDSTISNPDYFAQNTGSTTINDTLILTAIDTISGCTFIDEVAISTFPLPDANTGLSDTICSGESALLGLLPIPGVSCTWSGTGLANPNACQTAATPLNSTGVNEIYTYILDVSSNSTGCVNQDSVVVISKPLPIVDSGSDTAICSEQTIQLGTTPTAGYSYSWVTTAGTPVAPTSSSQPIQTFLNNGSSASTTFSSIVTVLNTDPTNFCTNRDTIDVTVNRLPTVNVIADTSICSNDSINIGGVPVNNLVYEWNTQNGLNDSTLSNPALIIDNPTQTTQTFTYQLITSNSLTGCIDSAQLTVDVRPLPIVSAGQDIEICSESSDTIGTAALPGLIYTWATSTNLDDSTIARPVVSPLTGVASDTLTYLLTAELNGCFDSDTTIVITRPKPVVDTILGGLSICPDLTGVQYNILDTIGFINYEWGISGGNFDGTTNNDSVVVDWGPANSNAFIYMIPTNSFGCVGDTAQLDIIINTILTSPPPVGPTSICLNNASSVPFQVPLTTGYTYTWSTPTVNHNVVSTNNVAIYSFLDTGLAQIFVEQAVTTVTSVCLGFSDTLLVRIHPDPSLDALITGDTSLCELTDSTVYSINGLNNSTYQWTLPNGGTLTADTTNTAVVNWDTAGNYNLIVFETSEFGCTSGNINLSIQVNPIPETEFASIDTFVCQETLQGNAFGVNGFDRSKFVWEIISGSLVNNDSSANIEVEWQNPENGNLELTVFEISEFNCIGDTLGYVPQIDLSLPLVDNVTLTDPADTFSTVAVSYNLGDNDQELLADSLTVYRKIATEATWTPIGFVGKNDSLYLDQEVLNRRSDFYEYQVSAINLCNNEVFSPEHNTIKLEGNGIEIDDQLNLSWNSYENWVNGVDQYEIYRRLDEEETFEVYESSSMISFSDFSANDGFRHYFRIRAIENNGEGESWSNEFEVTFQNIALIANVITPNGDGFNDTWKIDNYELYPETTVEIYNREGRSVYESNDYKNDWTGDNLPSGTYFYNVKFLDRDDAVSGFIQILR